MIDRDPAARVLRGAIVGYGFIAERGHLPAYARPGPTRFEIVAVAEACPARRERVRAMLPRTRVYAGHEELFDRERAELDFVDICVPPSEHAGIARSALSRGLHVLCEKPLATNVEDAHTMTADARRARRVLFPSHNYKHAPVIRTVRRTLDAQLLGRVKLVTLQTFRNTHARGVGEWRPDWRREKIWAGGGVAMDHGSHAFYLAFDWLEGYPTAITAKMSTSGRFDTEDNFTCTVTFPRGVATAHLSWTAGVRKVIYTIHAERGAIRVEDDEVEVALRSDAHDGSGPLWELKKEKVASDWMDPSHAGWFRPLLEEFSTAIANQDFVSRETESSVRCVELISAAYASAGDGSRERALAREP
jgi:predicted dehydrogenase